FKDGLSEVLKTVQKSQMEVAWNAHVHQTFVQFASMHGSRPVERRRKSLILSFLLDQEYAIDEIAAINEPIRVQYENLSRRTLQRDIDALQVMGLLKLDSQSGKYRAWSGILQGQMAHVRDSRILH
ncbi:MAG TPA: Fic family protein, partial [Leptospiraceae bacterium]|nr:Fic family protein [Leptospiraceae bacterium]